MTNTQGDFLLTAASTHTLLFQALGYKPYRLLLPGSSLSQLVPSWSTQNQVLVAP